MNDQMILYQDPSANIPTKRGVYRGEVFPEWELLLPETPGGQKVKKARERGSASERERLESIEEKYNLGGKKKKTKVCKQCGKRKNASKSFYANLYYKDNKHPICKNCVQENDKKRRAKKK